MAAVQTQLNTKAPIASPTFTGTATIPTLSLNGVTVTSTAAELNILYGVTATTAELNYVDGVTSNIQTQLDAKSNSASPTFTGTVTIPTADINGGAIDGTAIGGTVASTGNFSTLSIAGTAVTATAAEINKLDGLTATTTELNYTDGVTSNIQTQLNAKAPTASPSFSGTVSIPTLSLNGTTVTALMGNRRLFNFMITLLKVHKLVHNLTIS